MKTATNQAGRRASAGVDEPSDNGTPRTKPRRPKGRPRHSPTVVAVATSSAKAILGRALGEPAKSYRESLVVGSTWTGRRKQRKTTYSIPAQTADALWLDNKLVSS